MLSFPPPLVRTETIFHSSEGSVPRSGVPIRKDAARRGFFFFLPGRPFLTGRATESL